MREVLFRSLYRSEIVWTRTRKRDQWGQSRRSERTKADWVHVPAPELRIVPEPLWKAAHARLTAARAVYIKGTNGRRFGRPPVGNPSNLLTNLAQCGCCGGSLKVRTRSHRHFRAKFYGCSGYHDRGQTVCHNGADIPMEDAVDIDKNVVRRVLVKHDRSRGGDGPSWLSFIGHARDSLRSVDFFRCESIVLQSYWVLVVMDQCPRRLIGLGVHHGDVDGANLCRMFNEAIRGQGTPRHLSTDHDPLFEAHRWQANLRVLEIDEIKTVPHVPMSHPFAERLIWTAKRRHLIEDVAREDGLTRLPSIVQIQREDTTIFLL